MSFYHPSVQPYISGVTEWPESPFNGMVIFDTGSQSLMTYYDGSWHKCDQSPGRISDYGESLLHKVEELFIERDKLAMSADKYDIVNQALLQLEVALKLCKNIDNGDS